MHTPLYHTLRAGMAAVALTIVSACAATSPENTTRASYDYDPIEPVNRGIFRFNEFVDTIVLEPAARAYRFVVPKAGRRAVGNFFTNMSEPVTVLNATLQRDPERAFTAFWRFTLNSTFGAAGLFDWAEDNAGLEHRREDFGQTLAIWGAPAGPYLVLPLMGPSNVRDTVGQVVDGFSDPFNYDEVLETDTRIVLGVVNIVDLRKQNIEVIEDIYDTSFDPYSTIRSGYLQRRDDMIRNGKMYKGKRVAP